MEHVPRFGIERSWASLGIYLWPDDWRGRGIQGSQGLLRAKEAPQHIQTAISASASISRRACLQTHVAEALGPSEIGKTSAAGTSSQHHLVMRFQSPKAVTVPARLRFRKAVASGGELWMLVKRSSLKKEESYLKSRRSLNHALAWSQLLSFFPIIWTPSVYRLSCEVPGARLRPKCRYGKAMTLVSWR